MRIIELTKKLGRKLFGKKGNNHAAGEYPGVLVTVAQIKPGKKAFPVLLGPAVIERPEHWRN